MELTVNNPSQLTFLFFGCLSTTEVDYSDSQTQDQLSTRANTLGDDADDIQKQLDNEANDRIERPHTVWVFHFPTQGLGVSTTEGIFRPPRYSKSPRKRSTDLNCTGECKDPCECKDPVLEIPKNNPKDWSYRNQSQWNLMYPECGGRFQSPVDLPFTGMIPTKGSRPMLFRKYSATPKSMLVVHDGKTVSLFGDWDASKRPVIYGGAAHSRRYVFHSLAFHWPSEHTVGGLYYPLESQAIHVSVEYNNVEEAIKAASRDKLALLVVANIYKYSKYNHEGLEELVLALLSTSNGNRSIHSLPLKAFSPPLKEYAAYHGSLTIPPCSEAVLWLVRARSMPITRELAEELESTTINREPGQSYFRLVNPLNDRKIYFFI